MKAIMYGGNIGRGFVGALLSQSGYRVTFVDVQEPVVKALQEKETYPVRYVSTNGYEDVWIENVTAVNGNDGEPLRVCVEKYGFLPVDKAAFKGEIPKLSGLVPYAPFDFYIKRKLYVHNMGHATCAYLGDLLGLDFIYQSIALPWVRLVVQNAMIESAMALCGKYGGDLSALQMHIQDLLNRFTNAALGDTCQRVGGDPARKLSPDDRLIGSAKLALEQGITPAYIAVGAAAGLHRYLKEADKAQNRENALAVLREVSHLDKEDALTEMILARYAEICAGATPEMLCLKADEVKAASLTAVV